MLKRTIYTDNGAAPETVAERDRLREVNAELLEALENLQNQIRTHIKMDVKKHYSLMLADVAASKAIAKSRGES